MTFPIAISPCPNDTYLFHAWIHGLVGKELPPEVTFADIQHLNTWALEGRFPLIKLSFNCFQQVLDTYQLLPVGSALGFNCGPKIIAKTPFPLSDLPEKKVAIPGQDTTAHLLFQRLAGEAKEKHFCLYDEVAHLVETDRVDCGVIIHESRFTFAEKGFVEICDLGTLWHAKTEAPLPLGGVAVRRDLPKKRKQELAETLRASLNYARSHPDVSRPFILEKAQEQTRDVVEKHIATYVNQESEHLSEKGREAIETLLGCGEGWLCDV